MGEVAGLVLSAVGLAACFDSCLSAFNYVDSGTKYGKDYQKAALKISILQLRLSRWKESVWFVDDASIGVHFSAQVATREEVARVAELLAEIQNALEDAQHVSRRYKLKESIIHPDTEQTTMDELTAQARDLAIRRQGHASIGQKARWALHDRKKLDRLVEDLESYITSLVNLFPAIDMKQRQLAKTDALELVQRPALELSRDEKTTPPSTILQDATFQTDRVLYKEVQINIDIAKSGHTYEDMEVGDEVKAKFGNEIAADHKFTGPGHNYKNIRATGKATVLYGDSYGMRSIFDT